MKNWKTSAAGVCGLIVAITSQLQALWDNDPATIANWGIVMATVPITIATLLAKDKDVTGGTRPQ